jgi:anti-sigma B factor antagonist
MEITSKQFKHCDLLTVKGRVDSATSPKLSEALDAIVNEGRFKIVIDMAGLEYMSSAGFRALISAQRNCRRYNRGEVVLASVPANIHSALELAGFTSLFRLFPDVTAAVGNL